MALRLLLLIGMIAWMSSAAVAQLPPDAVMLDKVKVSEKQKSEDLDPVTLEPSDPAGATWEHKGVKYRGSKPDSKDKFMKDPDTFAAAAAKQRYVNNFAQALSTVWCPVTDEITPGGMTQWKRHGLVFESCCSFCDENFEETQFEEAKERLLKRGAQSFDLKAKAKLPIYVEGAKSPVEGAIKTPEDE